MAQQTAKEKADELVTKCRRCLPMNLTTMLDAKQCALIAVDEIIKLDYNVLEYYGNLSSTDYWYEVKQEIEKL